MVEDAAEVATVGRGDFSETAEALCFAPAENFPEWFQETQRAAWGDFLATEAPKRTDEPWRFASIKSAGLEGFVVPPEVASEGRLINSSTLGSQCSAKLVFGNNRLLHREVNGLPEGVVVVPLAEAARDHEGLMREYFMTQPVELGSHRFAALHRAMVTGGVLVHVPANVEVAEPIEIHHWVEGENASVFPHTLIICGANSKVTVVDRFVSADGHRALACGVNDLHAGPGSNLQYVSLQDWSPRTTAFHINSTIVDRDATSTALALNLGGHYVRGESLSRMIGPGARSVMLSINPTDGDREIDQRTLQDHSAPHATSDLLYHNSLDDSARTIFAGLIKVGEGAHGTDAYQKVRNLLLSDEAEANSMPGLEILADEVACSHGATSGQINQDEIFYMQARGIPERLGRRLILAGFFDNLLGRIEGDDLRAQLSGVLHQRLGIPTND
jgi:Fe-S cluster assembly protein SufD